MGRAIRRLFYLLGILTLFFACAGVHPVLAQGGGTYVVRAGDTMISIAARHGVTATQLAAANGLRWNAWVYVGQQLRIPGQGSSTPSAPASGGTYVVRAGDSLNRIAARYGVTVSQLAAANGLRTNAWVYVGQQLRIPGQGSAPPAPSNPSPPATPGGTYVVRPGDTLISIAARHQVTVSELARANGLYTNSWVYTGQQLKIPGESSTPSNPTPTPPTSPTTPGGTYVVRPGDTLIGIATRHGISVSRLAAANGLHVNAWVYVGQRLQIPGGSDTPPSTNPSPNPPSNPGASGTRWIDVNITTQTLTAYAGQTPVFTARVSTGIWRYPTVVGTFQVYVKYLSTHMSGPGYSLPNVPYTMYFYRGYALHGTYWHSNFGTPMSHGCVNLSIPDAKWLYEWASVGTKVVTHY
jgi:LysM repeat protein